MALARHKKHDPLKNALSFEKPVVELDLRLAELTAEREAAGDEVPEELAARIETVTAERDEALAAMAAGLTTWQRIQISRHVERPVAGDYADLLFTDVLELHGDRVFGDDRAILTALARLGGRRCLLVAHRKGRTTEERIACNWGCAHPEGYRKARRCMELAARMGLSIVTLINTPGAYPGIGAEERGQASAIAWNLFVMARLPVPIVSAVVGEGGSGGALGIGVCDRLLCLENSYYSVISPEGCASILWKDGSRAEEAAEALKLDSSALAELGVADEILPEPTGGAHRDKKATAATLGKALGRHLDELAALPADELLALREQKYRSIGPFRMGGTGEPGEPVPA